MAKFHVPIDIRSTDQALVEVEADSADEAVGAVEELIATGNVENHIVSGGDDPSTDYSIDHSAPPEEVRIPAPTAPAAPSSAPAIGLIQIEQEPLTGTMEGDRAMGAALAAGASRPFCLDLTHRPTHQAGFGRTADGMSSKE